MRRVTRKLIFIAAALLLFPGAADIRDHLEPEESIYQSEGVNTEYADIVVSVLNEAFAQNVRARMLTLPSFHPESVIGLRQTGDRHYEIFFLQPEVHLWGYELLRLTKQGQIQSVTDKGEFRQATEDIKKLEAALPAKPKDVKVHRCVAPIGDEPAKRLFKAWELLLHDTRYFGTEDVVGSDGDTYHFWFGQYNSMAGKIWSPPPNSKPGRMIQIMETLRASCEGSDRKLEAQALHDVDTLIADLQRK